MAYDIKTIITGEQGAGVDEFVNEVNEALTSFNQSWATVKAGIPADQQAAAETKVRVVLKQ